MKKLPRLLLSFWSITLLTLTLSSPSDAVTFDRYHSLAEIEKITISKCTALEDSCRVIEMGQSTEGRRLFAVELGADIDGTLPAIYLNAAHHGNEKSSTESMLGVLHFISENLQSRFIRNLFSRFTVIIQPVVNPDGYARNSRGDKHGIDPNRDYAFPDRSEDESFKMPETDAVRELMERRQIYAAAAFHSGMEGILWPWCYTKDTTNDHNAMRELARRFSTTMGIRMYQQSFNDYPTRGEFIDYAYWRHGTLALTIEVSNRHTPPIAVLQDLVARSIAGTLAFLSGVMEHVTGTLEIQSGFSDSQIALN